MATIRLLDEDEPTKAEPPDITDAFQALGIDPTMADKLMEAMGGEAAVQAAVQQLGAQLNARAGMLAGPTLDELDGVMDAQSAHKLSEDFCKSVLSGIPALSPEVMMQLHMDMQQIDQENGRAGSVAAGTHRSKLLQSGIILHYQEFGSDSAPPIVLIHDVGDCRQWWDEVARLASRGFRVLAVDLRGHGNTPRSPRRLYGLDELVADIHDGIVVELSLNGRDWEGKYTRAWTLCGRGLGAAVACAYAARYPGRCSALMLCDFDPAWRKDRLAFHLFQAALFPSKEQAAAALNVVLGLGDDPSRIARAMLLRTTAVDTSDPHRGVVLRMDPFARWRTQPPAMALLTLHYGPCWSVCVRLPRKCWVILGKHVAI